MSRPHVYWSLLICSFLLLTGCQQEQDWQTFDSAEGKFRVEVRGTPDYSPVDVPTEVGSVKAHNHVVESHNGKMACFVMYCDYPAIVALAEPMDVLDGARQGAIQNAGLTLISNEEIEVEGGAGQSFQAKGKVQGQDMVLNSKIFLYENRLYQVMVVSTEDLADSEDVSHFLDSFEVTSLPTEDVEEVDEIVEEPAVEEQATEVEPATAE